MLHPTQFAHILCEDLVDDYAEAEKEYKVPIPDRIYCKCSNYLGTRVPENLCEDNCLVTHCKKCHRLCCARCEETQKVSPTEPHLCDVYKFQKHVEELAAFQGLKKGTHFQFCPAAKCQRRIELAAACNHMTCEGCGTPFCYLCGAEAGPQRDHWREGGCPLYLTPDDPRRRYAGARNADADA